MLMAIDEKVFFLTGVDDRKCSNPRRKPGAACKVRQRHLTQKFIDLWKILYVQYDEWAETTDERHTRAVQKILQRLFEQGQIYKHNRPGITLSARNNF